LSDGVELLAGKTKVRVTAFREGIFRVRVAPDGNFAKDFSWAVIEDAQAPRVQIEDAADAVKVTAGNVTVRVKKAPLLIDFLDAAGNVVVADEPSLPMAWQGGQIHVWKKCLRTRAILGWETRRGR